MNNITVLYILVSISLFLNIVVFFGLIWFDEFLVKKFYLLLDIIEDIVKEIKSLKTK